MTITIRDWNRICEKIVGYVNQGDEVWVTPHGHQADKRVVGIRYDAAGRAMLSIYPITPKGSLITHKSVVAGTENIHYRIRDLNSRFRVKPRFDNMPIPPKDYRRRKPQDMKHWPPSMTQEQVEQEIDKLCGCKGRWNCDCVSVFNQVCTESWGRHNTKGL